MEVQAALGSEIVMAFDECAAGDAAPEVARASMELTARWAKRSRTEFDRLQSQATYVGIRGERKLTRRLAARRLCLELFRVERISI